MKYQVIESYEIAYPNPIKLVAGDSVTITKRETNPAWLGWFFCVDKFGIGGWVSETYLKIEGDTAVAIRDYDATELSVRTGQVVESLLEEFGWAWVQAEDGGQGWVPLQNLN